MKENRVELNRLLMEGENLYYDELISSKQDLKFAVLEEKMKEILRIGSLDQDILRTIGVLDPNGKYNNAGALLADANRFSGIDCARFGETTDIILDRETFDRRSVLSQYDDVVSLFKKYYRYDVINGLRRETIEKIPEKAFRETIANALVHRMWDINSHIRVAMFDDRIEVYSPGGLPSGITEQEYLEGRISGLRNPILGGVFFRLHIIESFGTGIRRINDAYRDSDTKPVHSFSPNSIKVTLPVIRSAHSLSKSETAVYDCLGDIGKSSSEIAEKVGYGKNKTLEVLSELEQKGIVRKTGNGRGTKYRIRRW